MNGQIAITFNKTELIHMRRFLNRAVDCAEGKRSHFYRVNAWYYTAPLLKKVHEALEKIKGKK